MKTALVTGSEGGLGTALCDAFRDAGYRVLGTDRARGDSTCDDFVALDLLDVSRDARAIEETANLLRAPLEGEGLSVLINNAAVQRLGGVEEVTPEDWRTTLEVNLTAPLFLVQALLPDLERGGGSVIHIGSVHARATKPGFVSYATSKAALAGLTRAMAVDLAPKIRVNALRPAAIETPMLKAGFEGREDAFDQLADTHPIGRIARPEEVARAAVFLASAEAGFVTGATLDVDGGILSRLHDPL